MGIHSPTTNFGNHAPDLPFIVLNTLSTKSVQKLRNQYLCDPEWFRDIASHVLTTPCDSENTFSDLPIKPCVDYFFRFPVVDNSDWRNIGSVEFPLSRRFHYYHFRRLWVSWKNNTKKLQCAIVRILVDWFFCLGSAFKSELHGTLIVVIISQKLRYGFELVLQLWDKLGYMCMLAGYQGFSTGRGDDSAGGATRGG
ncbi:hypothetical protein F511_18229 [Dorcoceras hygrometricum]|uniref:Uncharacterized protein n=1 Tax=Dorcoceras hygrometricum TaxID=472368 RepID=A0A2Z7BMM9_9LAMI|nr:hypothetical protein F511_18229 [Dorcoceras hygrometricum]